MVRIKHRYLLVNILYPEQEARNNKQHSSGPKDGIPYTVQFRRPGPDQLSGKLLSRLIRESVADLFGDYGAGVVTGSLMGRVHMHHSVRQSLLLTRSSSQILLPSNKHSHHPRLACPLPHGLGSTDFYNSSTSQAS